MKTKILLITVLLFSLTLSIAACSPNPGPADSGSSSGAPAVQNSSLDGKTLVESRCTVCHGLDRISSKSKSEAEWTATVERMIGKGAQFNDSEKAASITYLAETYK